MSEEKGRDWDRVDALLNAQPHVRELADGSFRVEKAGVVGVGPTIDEATADMAEKLTAHMLNEPGLE